MFSLKEIISSIADVGQKLFKKEKIKKNDLESIIILCDDLISNKGAAFGITVARNIIELYQTLSVENKLLFFKKINEKNKPSFRKVNEAIDIYKNSQNEKNLSHLFRVSEGSRRELFTRMNMAPNGTSAIVSLREDLIKILKDNMTICHRSLDAKIFPPKIRYTVDIRQQVKIVLRDLTDIFSSEEFETNYLDYSLV